MELLELKKDLLTLHHKVLCLQARIEALEKDRDLDVQIASLERMIKERGEDKHY